ncbi:MAG TPA: ATP-binding protein [Thermoanaerobaculia bacterium]
MDDRLRGKPVDQETDYAEAVLDTVREGLRASEMRYRLLFETAREGIWLLDGDTGKVIDANPFLLELLGFRKDELVGREPWHLYGDREAARSRFEEVRKRGFSYDPELTMRSKSGSELRIEAVSNLYSVGASRVLQCNMRDLTDRSRLEGQLRQMQKLESIGHLAGGVAHDFNNILNIISAHTAVLDRNAAEAGDERSRESARAIEQAVRRGAGVVKQLLTFARRTETSFEPLDLNGLIDEVRKMVVETFPKTVRLRTELDPDLPRVLGDANQIHQALLNLVVNARDAMAKGGTITLKTHVVAGEMLRRRLENATADQYVSIEVADQGPGMNEEVRKRLFEPFFTTKEKGKGAGMGLAVVYGVVQAHQGTIDVESQPGKGTCFALYFPVSAAAAKRPAEPEEPAAETRGAAKIEEGRGRTILFVEDEELLQTAIRSLLEDQGYRVLTAGDGLEAVAMHAAHKSEIDAVIVDLGLPKLDGWEAFLRMKKADPELKAIIASGILDAEKRTRMRREGIQATLRKPYGAPEIMKILKQVLED